MPLELDIPVTSIIKGDAKSITIAAASVVAKVYRDKIMADLAKRYPYYGFEKNAGYGTKAHVVGLNEYGIIPGIHRISYKPIQEILCRRVA